MGESHGRLKVAAEGGFTYRHVPQEMVNAPMDQMLKAGVLKKRPDGVIAQTTPGSIHLPQFYECAFICNLGASHRLAQQFTASNRLAVVKLLDGVIQGIRDGDLLAPLVCVRSCVEQVAHYHHSQASLQAALRAAPNQGKFGAAWQAMDGIREKLSKICYGTRLDWMAVALSDPTKPLNKKETAYKPTENRLDRTVKSILNAVDDLDGAVPGVRATYETLCEFAHPNVGTIFVLANSCEVLPADSTGVTWIEKKLGLQPPAEFVRSFHAVLERVFGRLVESLAHYEKLLKESDAIRDEILRQVQSVIRHVLFKRPDLFGAYDACPCGGGKKVKFCCGKEAPTQENREGKP